MSMRDERREQAQKHIATMNTVFASETAKCAENARIFEDGEGRELEIPAPEAEDTSIDITTQDTVSALYAAKGKVIVLDFASFTTPGGAYDDGAWAQEQALCSESNLFPILSALKDEYYEKNRGFMRGSLYTDRSMFLDDVKFTRHGQIKSCGVIVCAAPNRTRALESVRAPEECDADLGRRIENIMRIAASQGCDALVLGAFGCGVFGNDPTQVATLFKAWLDAHPGVFANVVFAIPNGPNLAPFREVFSIEDPAIARRAEREAARAEEDADDESLEDMELPEGVTLRS